ncbi:EAL domain-containing protein [Sphaerotilus mobilis]|uniref:PAS domain S-box-containing protein/diguanylate cyclase (GGDEF)-like protein n=1 Tax=Sphaerotilus mobilis TaxID=47994 RepID=A0A4Q7LTR8_9BURK|nr:EAL domain-containing protein [Sphaerotilus mobilis]RZS58134.1 PAS domain S-box-containing protein/diguanylate cyclase (GGDEF)-like protein [Sphaerotilus mobilis]
MLTLLARLVARLTVGRKLMLIYLLDLSSVFYVAGFLINEKYLAIDFARKELAGSAYVAVVADALVDVAGATPAQRLADHLARLEAVAAQHDATMRSADASGLFAAALRSRVEAATTATTADTAPSPGQALAMGRDLLTRLGNQSNLILDPDLDSYYTMSIVVLRLPELLDVVQGIAEPPPLGRGVDLLSTYLVLEGRLDAVRKGLRSDHDEAYAAGTAELVDELRPVHLALEGRIEAFRVQARAWVDAGMTASGRPAMLAARDALLQALDLAWQNDLQALDGLLQRRIDTLFGRMWLHLGTALFLLLCIFGLVSFVAGQIARPLRRLSDLADTVRQTGQLDGRISWQSHDEIGRLIDAFHDMLGQLDAERERQKERAARERAAEAQRSLLETLPVALLVTAVPGHEVLHANTPARAWIGERDDDPWARCLDATVRARFFQSLHDRDAIDEFEVHWRGPQDLAWAVLSARRMTFQGRDAVLTALAPINHLKQLEQRLELWAKVFETSGEGIFIVDAQRQRLLTANRALTHGTGHDLVDLIGSDPAELLGGETAARAWQVVVDGLRLRGSWQGELRIARRDGGHYPAWLIASSVRDRAGAVSHWVCTTIDISDRKESERRIRFLAEHDVLTELPNRALCRERLRLAIQQAGRNGQKVGVLFIDLDRFKNINDSLGHHMGDGLLRSVALRLTEAVRAGDTVSRLGGDEFVVVLNGVVDIEEMAHVVEQRLIPLVRRPHAVQGAEIHVSCSVGVAVFPDDGNDLDELMRLADVAMYQAKAQGRDSAHFYTPELNQRAQQRALIETQLRHAVQAQELSLHYQPRMAVDASGERCVSGVSGMEALLRWHSPVLGQVGPDRFVPIAEETGLIVEIGNWVIETACAQIAAWRAAGVPGLAASAAPPLCVSINLSAVQLGAPDLIERLRVSLHRHAIPAGQLEIEITESTLMDRVDTHLRTLHAIRALGVRLAIDDFGTGYSSLNYLNRFPIDLLKIDRSFVRDMLDDPRDLAIVKAIIGLGHTLDLRVVAEGVEGELEAQALRAAGCDELQGYHYARPMPAEALADWLGASADLSLREPAAG